MKPEILAPVGAKEQLIAAVFSGADAVYLGTKGFNARRNADNFEEGTLKETVSFCHARNVKVYVTLNILVLDSEAQELVSTLKEIAESGADAVIVQDLGVMSLVKRCIPDMPLHASTQMAVHNLAGAKMLESMGFRRVVLAREMSLAEIKEIRDNTSLEIEVFVHGALCMCMSGMCYLSSVLGGRSGNRGLCAQPCRLDFSIKNKKYALSLKDNSAVGLTGELIEAGVDSFKIEGRMKRPEYVAAAVEAFRKELSGEKPDTLGLEAVFSRSGFTNGYLLDNISGDMFGIRTAKDAAASASVLKKMQGIYKNEYKRIPINASLTLSGEDIILNMNGVVIIQKGAEKARNKPLDFDTSQRLIAKTGDTPYYLRSFTFENNEGLTASASVINAARREAISLLAKKAEEITGHKFEKHLPELSRYQAESTNLRVRIERLEQLSSFEGAEKIIVPLFELAKNPDLVGPNIAAEIPAVLFSKEQKKAQEELFRLKKAGLSSVYCENIGAVYIAKKLGLEILGGASLNITNTAALSEYEALGAKDLTLSFELRLSKAAHIGGKAKRGIIGYGYLPLMRFRACPAKQVNSCGMCEKTHTLFDRIGKKFTLLCEDCRYGVLLNSTPLYIADKEIKNLDFVTLYFTKETNEECRKIFDSFKNKDAPDFERTNGLYFRDLL